MLLGTQRSGRMSEHAAKLMVAELAGRPGIETGLIDAATLPITTETAGEEAKDPAFSEAMNRADALVVVSPEYNHGYPGLLKHVLDTNLHEYIHKAVGVVGVSAGVFGGTRMIQDLLPVLRELGLVTIFWDVNVTSVHSRFGADGELLDETLRPRIAQFLDELVWMAETLRYGRENIAVGGP